MISKHDLHMSLGEINRRYREGTPVSILADLNGVEVFEMIPFIDRLHEVAKETEDLSKEEATLYWAEKGYTDSEVARILGLATQTARTYRIQGGLDANPSGTPVKVISKDGTEQVYSSTYQASKALGIVNTVLANARKLGRRTQTGYLVKEHSYDVYNLVEKTIGND